MIFKIVSAALWHEAEAAGIFRGAPVDRRDGFIHFSTAEQVVETAAKHFGDETDLLLVAVDPDRVEPQLRWEASRGNALFPHLYDALDLSAVVWVKTLPFRAGIGHDFVGLLP